MKFLSRQVEFIFSQTAPAVCLPCKQTDFTKSDTKRIIAEEPAAREYSFLLSFAIIYFSVESFTISFIILNTLDINTT